MGGPAFVAGATKAGVALLKKHANDPYQTIGRGQLAALHGHISAALALPVFTFADLHSCADTIEHMVEAYYVTGGNISTSTAVRRARLSGKPSAEMIRFLLYCEKNYKKDSQNVTT